MPLSIYENPYPEFGYKFKAINSLKMSNGALLAKIIYLENLMLETMNCAMKTVA